MRKFRRFNSFPPEIRQQIWQDALQAEAEDRYVLVHRSSLKVIPHKRSTRSAVMVASREARYCALRFYDIKLDVWTIEMYFDYVREVGEYREEFAQRVNSVFPRQRNKDPEFLRMGNDTIAFWQGRYGKKARDYFARNFWEYHMRDIVLETIKSRFKRPAQLDVGNKRVGCVYLSSQFDKFTLSSVASSRSTARSFNLDVCVDALLQRQKRKVFHEAENRNRYKIRHTTTTIPSKALQKIRSVVDAFYTDNSNQHRCGGSHWNKNQWRLGTFKNADQLYRAVLKAIPAKTLKFKQSQGLTQWKQTEPGSQHPFICTCFEEAEDAQTD